jgi:EAL domain-containing protein (putative c-di-GMP-specific phosphodiesterase class I)
MTTPVLLDQILAPGGLRTVFQPIYRVAPGWRRLHGVECLTRGPRDTNGESAAVLFEYVRRKKQETAVDRACLVSALAAASLLGGEPRLSVNVHASTLSRDDRFPAFVDEITRRYGVTPERLTLEIIEHGPALDGLSFFHALAALRDQRIRIALDDVGVGTSTLRMMLDCRPDYLKVDRYFVSGAHIDPAKRSVLEAVAHIAHGIGAQVVAEGVELAEELDVVLETGIGLVQGHIFCAAVDTAQLIEREPALRPEFHPLLEA